MLRLTDLSTSDLLMFKSAIDTEMAIRTEFEFKLTSFGSTLYRFGPLLVDAWPRDDKDTMFITCRCESISEAAELFTLWTRGV